MSGVLRWEDPPPSRQGRRGGKAVDWQPIAEALRARPGVWAVVAESHSQGASGWLKRIRTGGIPPFEPAGAFESCCRGADPIVIYARYVGDPS